MKIKLKTKMEHVNSSYEMAGDKSIAHRSLIIGALGKGTYKIKNFPESLDCLSTLGCMKTLGVNIVVDASDLWVASQGYGNFNRHPMILNANNSGTTARLLSGVIAGAGIEATIDGDDSLRKRPMNRVIEPLITMGASIESSNSFLPAKFIGESELKGISYELPVASAQVKSCILLAGFMAKDKTTIYEKISTRDHTEKMLQYLGADISIEEDSITIRNSQISSRDIFIPGDISSAAFLIVCAILSDNASIRLENLLLSKGRKDYLDILIAMGADLEYKVTAVKNNEAIGYVIARSSSLKGIYISKNQIPSIIDEIPVLAVAAAFSEGNTIIEGIGELKFKESNRIKAIGENLKTCGVNLNYSEESIEIFGNNIFIEQDIYINSYYDHRIALAFAVFAVRNYGSTIIDNWECTNISFPNSLKYFKDFYNIQTQL